MKKRNSILFVILAISLTLSTNTPIAADISDTEFIDVSPKAWYANAVKYCKDNGLINGTGGNMFSPNKELSRAMLVTILHHAAGAPTVHTSSGFADVQDGAWYSDAVVWAAQNNIVTGYGNGKFGTDDPITREQLITILWRYMGSPVAKNISEYTDADKISVWALSAVNWGSEQKLVNMRIDKQFDPKLNANRAEAAFMIYHMVTLQDKPFQSAEISAPNNNEIEGTLSMNTIIVTVGDTVWTATLAENVATAKLKEILSKGPITISMSDYGGFEKVGPIGQTLPTADEQITTSAGDIILYTGKSLVVYYDKNSWNLTRIGRINNVTQAEMKKVLGKGSVEITFSLGK